jgi:predicted glycogen debranching enzyme
MSEATPHDPWPRVEVHEELSRARSEWLHTNGAGAYAASTVAGMHTRRYHGLLVAALDPPRGRHVVLSHVDVKVALDPRVPRAKDAPAGGPWDLAKHQFPEVDPDKEPFYLHRFDQDPLPRFTYAVAGGRLEVKLGLVRGANAVVLRYQWRGPQPVVLTLRPLLAMRHFHALTHGNGGMDQRAILRPDEVRIRPNKTLPWVAFRYEGTFVGSPDWWRRFEYLVERDRGLDFVEDLWTPGTFEVRLDTAPTYLVAAVDKLPDGRADDLLAATEQALSSEDPGPDVEPVRRSLTIAAEAYRADLAPRPGVIAGYPWFEVWGRDTLVAMPGLYLVPGKLDEAVRLLRDTLGAMEDGLVPNRIPDAGAAPEFHSADATLWLFEAARLVAERLGESHPFVTGELVPALASAFDAALRGTRSHIRVTEEGLFSAGRGNDSLTWMDARVQGRPVTPRVGCPVELTALWARGCETLGKLARAAGDEALSDRAFAACRRAREAFQARFWCEETSYPYDVIQPPKPGEATMGDRRVRPNAVIALAVDPACFTDERAAAVVVRARAELVTPAGLRTLAPGEPGYQARYGGGVERRDAAYHQGTVWPFLLGAYARAARRLAPDDVALRDELRALCEGAARTSIALGQVSELADGDAPHKPAGCVAQAWSVAELLRALAWDLA